MLDLVFAVLGALAFKTDDPARMRHIRHVMLTIMLLVGLALAVVIIAAGFAGHPI